jgi:hypothetical protein
MKEQNPDEQPEDGDTLLREDREAGNLEINLLRQEHQRDKQEQSRCLG